MKLSEKIYNCRKECGISQEKLAEILGVSRQSVSKWETGEAMPDLNKLLLISKTFNVSTDWLLSETEEVFVRPEEVKTYPGWIDEVPNKTKSTFDKYGWLIGVAVIIFGVVRLASSLSALAAMLPFGGLNGMMIGIIINIAVNLALIISGIILTKRLRKKEK